MLIWYCNLLTTYGYSSFLLKTGHVSKWLRPNTYDISKLDLKGILTWLWGKIWKRAEKIRAQHRLHTLYIEEVLASEVFGVSE